MYTRKEVLKSMVLAGAATTVASQPSLPDIAHPATKGRGRGWIHPAGILDVATLKDIKRKSESLDWAGSVIKSPGCGSAAVARAANGAA